MYTIKSQKDNTLVTIVLLILLITAFRFAVTFCSLTDLDAAGYMLALMVVYGVILLGGAFMLIRLLRTRKRKLTLHGSDCVYMPLLGAPRRLTYGDLDRVDMGGKTYVIYGRDGKKLVTFDDFHTENAHEIIDFLKQKGVKTQI
ncbi:MAG: hypothetical protein HFH93_13985 [Lachnospiraceae bacterium]|nr:hypothetical protein [Lachnospiraceae bacterium]